MAVYPRVYGGTFGPHLRHGIARGLSPRVRGNRGRQKPIGTKIGSIPACTGEPGRLAICLSPWGVYPRVYGGTDIEDWLLIKGAGLSPRVRGNHTIPARISIPIRSIPACTGEPSPEGAPFFMPSVYPRVYGGTPNSVLLCSSI